MINALLGIVVGMVWAFILYGIGVILKTPIEED